MTSAAIFPKYVSSAAPMLGTLVRTMTPAATPIVYVMDRDPKVCDALETLFRREGLRCETCASEEEFFAVRSDEVPNCLVLDASVKGALDFQSRIAAEYPGTPIILIAGRIDVPTTVRAMKAGAIELLVKPLQEQTLLGSIREALERSRVRLAHEAALRALRGRYDVLSRREREVMELVASGLLNKQVGGELGISEITVKAHRGQVMHKMKANSLADLVKMADKLGVAAALVA
jgi:FixJ family two-component response regulator